MNPRTLPAIGTPLVDLPTPCLLLDQRLLLANLETMRDLLSSRGKKLRAHAKTHKCSRLAAIQREFGAMGICAAKVSEARALVDYGIRGVLLTGPAVTPEAHRQILECAEEDPEFIATIDSLPNADRLSALFFSQRRRLRCLIDLDLGFGRTGISLANFSGFLSALRGRPGLEILGLQAYAGHIQHIIGYKERRKANQDCLKIVSQAVEILRREGFAAPIVSVGGTGSCHFDSEHPDVTEIQAGSYALMDAEYLQIGSQENSRRFDHFPPSLFLLTTVISANQTKFVTVDAGLKSVYRDGATPEVVTPGLSYDWFGDEYGKIVSDGTIPLPGLGDSLRLVVSHCDPTVNLFDHFHVIEDGRLAAIWPIDLRGCSQ